MCITIHKLGKRWKPKTNCFLNDAFLMGSQIGLAPNSKDICSGNRIMIMHANFRDEKCSGIYIVNELTGERVHIAFWSEPET